MNRTAIGLGVVVVSIVVVAIVRLISASPTPANDAVLSQEIVPTFDVPALVGNSLDELTAKLGTPDYDTEPTAAQLAIGTKTWEKSWNKGDYFLMATYDVRTREVVDLFLGANTDAGFEAFKDTNHILAVGNLSPGDSQYSVEFVKAVNAPGYTGATVVQRK